MRETLFAKAIGNWSSPLPHPRMAVYRNNVILSLVNALNVRFPVTGQLVGQAFFTAMARAFAEGNRPGSPVLIGYGEGFPAFIRDFPEAAPVPYLSDVARLESLWWQAYHAADMRIAAPEDFAAVPAAAWSEARFTFHPSLGQMQSAFAAGSIWQAHHGGAAMAEIATARPECVLIARPERQVAVTILSPATYDLVAALKSGTSLAGAVERAAAAHPGFDLGLQLQGLIGLGIITGIST